MTQPEIWVPAPVDEEVEFVGLSDDEVVALREQGFGNNITFKTSRTFTQILRENLFTFFNMVLVILGILLVAFGALVEAIITTGVLLINVVVASIQELRAKRKLDHIALLTRPKATVIRESRKLEIDPSEIVKGDLLVLGRGDQIVVDGRVVSRGRLNIDESLLTGESLSVPKYEGDSVQSGSFCVAGNGVYQATRVGTSSYANMLTLEARSFNRHLTPLQLEVNLIIRVLLGLALFFGVLLIVNSVINDVPTIEIVRQASVLFGLAPSSLFLMIVVAYAVGAVRIADKGALVQQANSVESLCNVDILCLDKTGTLTTNRLKLNDIHPCKHGETDPSEENLVHLLGDYSRSAMVDNRTNDAIKEACPGNERRVREEVPFSSQLGWSALGLAEENQNYVMGAPEILEPHLQIEHGHAELLKEWRAQGRRVLLFAADQSTEPLYDAQDQPHLPQGLVPLCLLNFSEELRPEAAGTLQGFADAGIKIKFISGDNPETVSALVHQSGLLADDHKSPVVSGLELSEMDDQAFAASVANSDVFGRITPRQKEQIIKTLCKQGHYVAMTGDGVNDVLALKRADLGIAMQSGSQATRNVADMVLIDDSFGVLPEAFLEGQRIMSGMEDILRLYLSRILSLAILIAAVGFVGAGFPFTTRQSAIISVITLSIPGFCLALWARPNPIAQVSLTQKLVHFVIPAAITISIVGFAIYLLFLEITGDMFYAQTMLTYTAAVCGILLLIFVEPPTPWWVGGDSLSGDQRPTILAFGLILLWVVFLVVPFLRDFYGLIVLRNWSHYLVVAAAAAVWVLAVRIVWRANLFERYLNIEPE